jgi:hypothetical protein
VQPCDLIPAGQDGLADPTPSDEGGARNCNWSNASTGYALEISIRDDQGLAEINTDGLSVTDDQIGHHRGRLAQGPANGDGCLVAVGVSATSRVDVTVSTSDSSVTHACSLANQFAKVVEPKLP